LTNPQSDINLIVQKIEELACHNNPGPTAVKAGEFIDETYLLIPREELPSVTFGTVDDAYGGGEPKGRIMKGKHTALTEHVLSGDTKRMREVAYEYLAMAEYVDQKKKQAEEAELNKLRAEAWNEIHPGSLMRADQFHWQGVDKVERNAIEAIVKLKLRLAKALENK
jgi:hypothetical protein